ncbi:MAG: hypothetical protein K8R23_19385 [Chthoniobacter sp.]|nr:hypothetical protein [Chthoniobacter sp.]
MWQVEPTNRWEKDQKHYVKKHPRELAAVLNNLDRYLSQLATLPNARCAAAGFLHPEQAGVLAVDQRGGGGNLQETRLYTYAHEARQVLYLIAIGNKDSQPSDVLAAKRFVESLLAAE